MIQVALRVVEGPESGAGFTFAAADRFLIGRAENAHFRLAEADPHISRSHCLLEICPPNVYLRDLGSMNGTFVDGVAVSEARLANRSRIRLGKTVMQVEISDVEAVEATPASPAPAGVPEGPQAKTERTRAVAVACTGCGNAAPDSALPHEDWTTLPYLCDACAAAIRWGDRLQPGAGYRLLGELGRGGMGVVYKARHTASGRLVALKKMLPMSDGRAKELFQREMAVLQSLRHPNIVRILDQGADGETCYFISELLEGGDLNKLVAETRRSHLTVEESTRYACDILEGLDWAHRRGYVHRDVKPGNILLDRAGSGKSIAKLTDFGLAKSFTEAGASFLTHRGEWCGTVLFMAPEQILNYRFVKPSADLYSVGVTLYYLISGRLPFHFPSALDRALGRVSGEHTKDEVRIILEDEPIPLRGRSAGVPEALASVIDRSIRKRESERFQTAGEMIAAIAGACGPN